MEKPLVLRLYCLLRQAERSLQAALYPGQWLRLQQYYDSEKRDFIRKVLAEIASLLQHGDGPLPCSHFSRLSIGWLVSYPFRTLWNRHRTRWLFPEPEVRFLAETGRVFLDALSAAGDPSNHDLIQLKINLYVSAWVIERRLVGLPELRRAVKIEHFAPSPHQESIPLVSVLSNS
jgi:hypothetical protein